MSTVLATPFSSPVAGPSRTPFDIPELAHAILTSTAAHQVPSSHLTVSSLFHAILLPHLYHTLALSTPAQWRNLLMGTPCAHLARVRALDLTIETEEVAFELLGRLVCRLSRELAPDDRARITRLKVRVESAGLAVDLLAGPGYLARLVALLPSLEALELEGEYTPSFASGMFALVRRMTPPSSVPLSSLKTLRLPLRFLRSPEVKPSFVVVLSAALKPTDSHTGQHDLLALPSAVERLVLSIDEEPYLVSSAEGDQPVRAAAFLAFWASSLPSPSEGAHLQEIFVVGADGGDVAGWEDARKFLGTKGVPLRVE